MKTDEREELYRQYSYGLITFEEYMSKLREDSHAKA